MSARIAGIALWLLAAVTISTQAQTVEYLHTDALGSVVAVTDASRTVLERREYEPYGSQLTPAVSNGPGYTGHVQDAATGLVYMQQRYYDAQIGRFLSMDPVAANSGTGANFNRYWYADNNPYTFVDPTGMCTGSRIENKDGKCVSSGGNTTETYGERESTAGGNSFAALARQLLYGALDAFAQAGLNQPTPDGFPIYTLIGQPELGQSGTPPQTNEEQLARDLGPAGLILGGIVLGKITGAATSAYKPSGLGDLTVGEVAAIQKVVNQAGRPLEVVGSAARGARRAGSDIDYVVPPSSLRYFKGLENQLPSLDARHGLIPGVGNPAIGSIIRFEPLTFP